ncbi:MAG: hypothetical protein WCJ51_00200 [Candidatus Moraniibacteriota bacterium]
MEKDLQKLAHTWITATPEKVEVEGDFYCASRDVFEAKNAKVPGMLIEKGIDEGVAYIIYSMLGEIGNNAFDHNVANWPDIMGIFFAVQYDGEKGFAIIADRGLGVLHTLRKAAPELQNDQEALKMAFTKKISGRILENRGNGLKFVKKNVTDQNMLLKFYSGDGQVSVNHQLIISRADNFVKGCLIELYF